MSHGLALQITQMLSQKFFFLKENLSNRFSVNYPYLIPTVKWKYNYIILKKKKKMNQNLANKYVPKFVRDNLQWYKRDGLMNWYDQGKCKYFLEDTGKHFQNTTIINFDIINNKNEISKETLKQYQTVDLKEIVNYSLHLQDPILSSAFRTKREDHYLSKESVYISTF